LGKAICREQRAHEQQENGNAGFHWFNHSRDFWEKRAAIQRPELSHAGLVMCANRRLLDKLEASTRVGCRARLGEKSDMI
jgi:hypothetical protein